jgi:hypothetical protein
MTQRLTLDQADFAKLVRGEIVTQGDLQCALQNIGHAQMFNALVDALTEELRLAVTGGNVPIAVGSSFREDEEEVRRWIYGVQHGEPSPPGSFLEAFVAAVRRADDGNYALLRPTILALKAKYPKYRFTGAL